MKTTDKPENIQLDKEEKWYENNSDGFTAAPAVVRDSLILAAKNTKNKTERMNIRMTNSDMQNLKKIAEAEGLPYQSLVTSILHKYISGLLIDINEAKKLLKY
jgi:predicted DNA binding CopG/RHH family protein